MVKAHLDDPDGWWNGVFLPKDSTKKTLKVWAEDFFGKLHKKASPHAPLHTQAYFKEVSDRLDGALAGRNPDKLSIADFAQLQADLKNALDTIRQELLAGTFPQ
jgi:hypothetical protein